MNKTILSLFSLFLIAGLTACGDPQPETQPATQPVPADELQSNHQAFVNNLTALCDETFVGESTFPENDDHVLVGTELRAQITECDDQKVRIELIRGGDYWHTAWVLELRDEGLHLYHDHLGDVRTMEDLGDGDYHGYGGYADDRGSGIRQYFPADDVTAEMIPAAATNVWMMELDLENDRFIYYLERHDQPRFRAELYRQ
jgi:hypothetical protein